MSIILDVYSLPRAERSRTRKLRDAFFEAYLEKHPDTTRVELDLARDYDKLPAFVEWDVQTKFEMAYGEGILDGEMASRWDALVRQTDKLHGANMVVVSMNHVCEEALRLTRLRVTVLYIRRNSGVLYKCDSSNTTTS